MKNQKFFRVPQPNLDLRTKINHIQPTIKRLKISNPYRISIEWPHNMTNKIRKKLSNKYGYDTKQSDGEVLVMLELWGRRSTSSLPSFPGPLWHWRVALDRVLSIGQIELNCVLMLNWIAWNGTVLKFKRCTFAELNCFK